MKPSMMSLRLLMNGSKLTRLLQSSHSINSIRRAAFSLHVGLGHCQSNVCNQPLSLCHRPSPTILPSSSFHILNRHQQSQSQSQLDKEKIAEVSSQMNMRLLNENSFLSWCRNAYLSSVVGIAMMEEATSSLGQTAGFGAFLVGGMNVFWGTSCHVINLVRLRHATGMSGLTLTLNILGSGVHCFLWLFVLLCYIGFLDDPEYRSKKKKNKEIEED